MARWVRWNNPTIKPPFGAQIDWSNPITEGLVGCWLFNEYGGVSINNYALSTYNKIEGDYTWTDTLEFNGNNTRITIPEINAYNYTEITVCSSTINYSLDISKGPIVVQGNYCIKLGTTYPDTYHEFVVYDTQWRSAKDSSPIILGRKYTLTGRYDGTNVNLFSNGNLVASNTASYISSTNALLSIGNNSQKARWFDGRIYYIYFFTRALSDLEIEQLHHEPYSFFLYPQYWYLVDFGGINSKEYSSLYDILNKNEYNNKYDIQAKTEKNIKYDILAQNSYVSKYDILTKKETNVSYDILIKTDYNISYDILNRLTKEVSYDILSAKEYNSKYDLLNSLASSILYNILTKNEYNVIYDILGTTAIEYTIQYDILNSAQTNIVFDILSKKEANIKYDILASRTSNIIYDILAKTLTNITYDILAKKETTFLYDIINKKEINFKYDILTTKLYTNIYNILTKSEYKILYDILSNIIIRPEVVFKLDKQDTIFKVGKINTIFKLK